MKRIAVLLMSLIVFAALALSGCMGMGTAGTTSSLEGGDADTSTSGLMGFLPLILIVVVFYFILIRPQNKKNKEVNQMRSALKRGDWITTIGGFRGRVVKVKEDLLTIEVGADKVKMEIMRWGISKIDTEGPDRKTTKKEREEEEAVEAEEKKRKPKRLEPAKKAEKPEEADVDDDSDDDEEE